MRWPDRKVLKRLHPGAELTRLLLKIDASFPDTAPHNTAARVNSTLKRRAKNKRARASRKRNRRG